MSVAAHQRLTEAEYLALEEAAAERHEFFNGELYVITDPGPEHHLIVANLATALRAPLDERSIRVYSCYQRVKIAATGLCTYPDVTVACGEQRFDETSPSTLLNPTMIIEVLSESTEAYDRGDKFEHYRQLGSVREYLLVSSKRPWVERYRRGDGAEWVLTVASGLRAVLHLASVGCDLPLAEVYDKLEFPPEGASLWPR